MRGSDTSEYANTRQPGKFRIERQPSFEGSAFGGISETRVDAIGVIVTDVVTEEPAKVVLAQDDHVIDKFALAGSQPPFRDAVLRQAPECRSFRLDAEAENVEYYAPLPAVSCW
jgi:hypothetical protein